MVIASRRAALCSKISRTIRCMSCGIGIIVMLGIYGVLQDRIASKSYGKEKAKFTGAVFLVFCGRLLCCLVAYVMTHMTGETMRRAKAPSWKFFLVSVSNFAAGTCQFHALRQVSFPVLMFGKSCKMIPVMMWTQYLTKRSYDTRDWVIAIIVTCGVAQILCASTNFAGFGRVDSLSGVMWLLLGIAFDGFTSTYQSRLFTEHSMSANSQMFYINAGSAFLALVLVIWIGELETSLDFFWSDKQFMMDLWNLSATAVGGQYFIYCGIKEFGALALATIMNMRQVLSVIISYVWTAHVISVGEATGIIVVLGALFYKWIVSVDETYREEDQEKKAVQEEYARTFHSNPNAHV